MRESVSTNLEWMGRTIHSYVEEVRAAAISYMWSRPEEERDEMCELICADIKTQIKELDRFSSRHGDKVYENILDFDEISERRLGGEHLVPITNLCTEYKKALMSYLLQLSERERLEILPSITAGILVLIADFRYKVQALDL